MVYLDEILDEKYDVFLIEENYCWNEYDDYTDNKPKLIKTFKTLAEAEKFLEICGDRLPATQKKYRGRITYFIRPMYLRHEINAVWTYTNQSQSELDEFYNKLLPPKISAPYTG
jgi:hypothetical protein